MYLLDQIFNEDCLEGMKRIPNGSVDMILCDMPYGTTQNKWDSIIPFKELWEQYERVIKPNGAIVLTAAQPFTSTLVMSNPKLFKYAWAWNKTLPSNFLNAKKQPLRCHEDVLVFYKKQCTYNPQKTQVARKDIGRVRKNSGSWEGVNEFRNDDWEWKEDGSRYPTSSLNISNWNGALFGNTDKATKHPTQKPVPLFAYLIRTYTNPGEVVLDNCMGSATTAIACLEEGRHFLGFEKEEKYFQMANKRIAKWHETNCKNTLGYATA